MSRQLNRLAPSLLLIVLAGSIAAAVNRYAAPGDGRGLLQWSGTAPNPVIRTGPEQYPRSAIDSGGYTVDLPRPPRRIVSQYWSLDEFLYAVVPPGRVVAVSESAYLSEISNAYPFVQRFHPGLATDPERVLRLDPDLILVSDSSRPDFCALIRDAHVPIYRAFTTFTTLNQIAETTRLIGYLTGEDDNASAVVKRFWAAIEAARAKHPPKASSPRVLGLSGQSTYGSETLFNDIVRTLGGINVGAEGGLKGYAEISSEQIARWNPEWIVTGCAPGNAKQTIANMLADPAIALTQAAHNGHILAFENRIFLPMSPFSTELLTALAEALYG